MSNTIVNDNDRQTEFCSRHTSLLILALVVIIVEVVQVGDVSTSLAQMSGPESTSSLIFGQVTNVGGNTLQVNNKDYELRPEVTVKDEEGQPMEQNDIVPGAEVKCRLKQGRIDQIVLILPK